MAGILALALLLLPLSALAQKMDVEVIKHSSLARMYQFVHVGNKADTSYFLAFTKVHKRDSLVLTECRLSNSNTALSIGAELKIQDSTFANKALTIHRFNGKYYVFSYADLDYTKSIATTGGFFSFPATNGFNYKITELNFQDGMKRSFKFAPFYVEMINAAKPKFFNSTLTPSGHRKLDGFLSFCYLPPSAPLVQENSNCNYNVYSMDGFYHKAIPSEQFFLDDSLGRLHVFSPVAIYNLTGSTKLLDAFAIDLASMSIVTHKRITLADSNQLWNWEHFSLQTKPTHKDSVWIHAVRKDAGYAKFTFVFNLKTLDYKMSKDWEIPSSQVAISHLVTQLDIFNPSSSAARMVRRDSYNPNVMWYEHLMLKFVYFQLDTGRVMNGINGNFALQDYLKVLPKKYKYYLHHAYHETDSSFVAIFETLENHKENKTITQVVKGHLKESVQPSFVPPDKTESLLADLLVVNITKNPQPTVKIQTIEKLQSLNNTASFYSFKNNAGSVMLLYNEVEMSDKLGLQSAVATCFVASTGDLRKQTHRIGASILPMKGALYRITGSRYITMGMDNNGDHCLILFKQ
jgi:hypothetical protein